jgi:hypothetical protein
MNAKKPAVYRGAMTLVMLIGALLGSNTARPAVASPSAWTPAQADFYGDPTAGPNVGGAGDRGIEAAWGSGRVLGPINYLIGNGLPTPIYDFNASNLNSWRAQEDGPGANSSFIAGSKLRLYSPTGSSSYRASACFGGCDGDLQAPGVPIAAVSNLPDIYIKWDNTTSSFPANSLRNFILMQAQFGNVYIGLRHIAGAGSNTLARIWNAGSGENVGSGLQACSTTFPSTPYGIGVRLRILFNGTSFGVNTQWLCGQYINTDYLAPNGATNVIDVGTTWGILNYSAPYQIKIGNRTESATSAPTIEIQYIRNVVAGSPTSAIAGLINPLISTQPS